jgi:hypothetical protein
MDINGIPQTRTGVDSIEIFTRGTYILVSEDSAGCYARDTLKVTILKFKFDKWITNVSCFGDETGMFRHGPVTGGEPPYYPFYWLLPNENGDYDTVPASPNFAQFDNLKAGIYGCYGIDNNGCAIYGEVEIKQCDSLKIKGIQFPTTCEYDNGKIKLSATGGLPPYKFRIEKEDGTFVLSSDSVSNLSTGNYIITVEDAIDDKPIVEVTPTGTVTTYPKVNLCETSDTIIIISSQTPNEHTIKGTVFDKYGTLSGVTITYSNDSITDSTYTLGEGGYSITVYCHADVVITPSLAGYIFTPPSIVLSDVINNTSNQDFTATNVGIVGAYGNASLRIYPNPTTGKLHITISDMRLSDNPTPYIEIYDIVGKLQHSEIGKSDVGKSKITIDISHLAAGLYFLKVDNRMYKIIKE